MYSKHLIKTASYLSAPVRVGLALLLVALALGAWPAPVARAATITVNSNADVVADDGQCTLREAITAANTDTASGGLGGECVAGDSGADTITLPANTYTLTGASGEDSNASGDLDITDDLTINGAAGGGTIIDGNQVDRVLHVGSGATVVINDVEITNGKAPDGADNASGVGSVGSDGGGIYNAGTLALNDCTVSENAAGDGGAGGGGDYNGGAGGKGGGIYNVGPLTLDNTTVYSNTAGTGGLCSGSGTSGSGGRGGGVYHFFGSATLTGSDVIDNAAGNGGAAGTGTEGYGGAGGGLYVFPLLSVTLTDCTVSGNTAGDGRSGGAGGGIFSEGFVAISDSTISGNEAGDSHGSGYGGGNGGGIRCGYPDTTLTLVNSTVSTNAAGDGSSGGDGAGIYSANSTVVMTGTTVSDNTGGAHTTGNGSDGGGIYVDGFTVMTATNSTISGNSAGRSGGGIQNVGDVTLWSCTIANNTADSDGDGDDGGGIYNGGGAGVRFRNTIIADNAALGGGSPDCHAPAFTTFTSQGYNLIEDTTGCVLDGTTSGNVTGVDPKLGPLALNGGPIWRTWTHALLDNSPALDAGSCPGLTTDQRAKTRPVDLVAYPDVANACDMGAFERQTGEETDRNDTWTDDTEHSFGADVNVNVTPDLDVGNPISITVLKRPVWPGLSQHTGEFQIVWTLSASGSPYSLILDLCYTEAELTASGVGNESTIKAYRWDEVNGGWQDIGGTPDAANNCVTVSGVTALSPWTIAGDGNDPNAVTLRESSTGGMTVSALWLALPALGAGAGMLLWRIRRRRRSTL